MASIRTVQSPAFKSFSSLLIALGGAVLLSAFLIDPLIAEFRIVINYRDVLSTYFIWAMSIGLLMVANGILLRWAMSDAVRNMSLLLMTCALILLSDRLLLVGFGLPLWMADLDSHYKHRPNAVRSWGSRYDNKLIQINSYGHHDDEFPLKKDPGQFIIMVAVGIDLYELIIVATTPRPYGIRTVFVVAVQIGHPEGQPESDQQQP